MVSLILIVCLSAIADICREERPPVENVSATWCTPPAPAAGVGVAQRNGRSEGSGANLALRHNRGDWVTVYH